MSETPLPQLASPDAPDTLVALDDRPDPRARKRTHTSEPRAVSSQPPHALTPDAPTSETPTPQLPAHGPEKHDLERHDLETQAVPSPRGSLAAPTDDPSQTSRPPPALQASQPAPDEAAEDTSPDGAPPTMPFSPDELAFVAALQAAGVALELSEAELGRLKDRVHGSDPVARRLDLLAAYYTSDDVLAGQRRRATDRWHLHRASDALTAPQILERLLDVVPELQGTELERVGGPNGTLVLRAGEDVCALEDEREEEPSGPTISVCDLVRALNVLLDRRSVRARLVGLLGDGAREGYLALPSVTSAIALSTADYLGSNDAETLLDLTGW